MRPAASPGFRIEHGQPAGLWLAPVLHLNSRLLGGVVLGGTLRDCVGGLPRRLAALAGSALLRTRWSVGNRRTHDKGKKKWARRKGQSIRVHKLPPGNAANSEPWPEHGNNDRDGNRGGRATPSAFEPRLHRSVAEELYSQYPPRFGCLAIRPVCQPRDGRRPPCFLNLASIHGSSATSVKCSRSLSSVRAKW